MREENVSREIQPNKEIKVGVESSLHLGLRWKMRKKIRKSWKGVKNP
jgi:hypothetical protein